MEIRVTQWIWIDEGRNIIHTPRFDAHDAAPIMSNIVFSHLSNATAKQKARLGSF